MTIRLTVLLALACTVSGALIGWILQPGSMGERAFAASISGEILGAFGGFVGLL
jgi:hypothetical protein